MRRTKEAAMETRHAILDAALDVFGEKNFLAVSVTEIADKVGMTKGAVYWHFKNKEDILVTLIEDFCARKYRDFTDRYGMSETLADLRDYYMALMKLPEQDGQFCKFHKLLMRHTEWPEELQAKVRELLIASSVSARDMVYSLLVRAREAGEITDPGISLEDAALLITASSRGLFLMQLSSLLPGDFSKPTAYLIDALTDALTKKRQ